jgi:hypothetical protein
MVQGRRGKDWTLRGGREGIRLLTGSLAVVVGVDVVPGCQGAQAITEPRLSRACSGLYRTWCRVRSIGVYGKVTLPKAPTSSRRSKSVTSVHSTCIPRRVRIGGGGRAKTALPRPESDCIWPGHRCYLYSKHLVDGKLCGREGEKRAGGQGPFGNTIFLHPSPSTSRLRVQPSGGREHRTMFGLRPLPIPLFHPILPKYTEMPLPHVMYLALP